MQQDEMTEPGDASSESPTRQRLSGRSTIVPRRGRKPASFWVSFTTMDEPYKSRSAPCRHCCATVNYHKKWEQARSHLLKCEPFLRLMQTTPVSARPEWFAVEIEKRRHQAARHLPIDLAMVDPSSDPQNGNGGVTTVTFRPSSVADSSVASRAKRRELLAISRVEWSTTSELLVLQAIQSGASVDPAFVQHLLMRENDHVRTLENLVNKVYVRVQHCVGHALRSASSAGGLAVLVVTWDATAQRGEFYVAKDDQCFFIECTNAPDSTHEIDAWLVEQIKRVMKDSSVVVHCCVVHASAEFVGNVISVWDHQLLTATPVRHSPLRALVEMVNDLVQSAVGRSGDENPLTGLLSVALQCQDVLGLLGVATPMPPSLSHQLDTTRRAVDGLRSLSLAEAFWVIKHADTLLNFDNARALLEQSPSLDRAANENVVVLVEDLGFTSRLERFRAVLQPLCGALALSEQRVVQASDVFVAWASIQKSYRDSECLTDSQTHFLLEIMATYKERIVQDGYTQVHLLDPAYMGELLDVGAKAKAEHELLSMTRSHEEDPTNARQALYIEYTQFQVAAVQQHQASGDDGFVLRMLKERNKTMLQYWLTDGRRWPRLQAVALAMEQAPADASVSWAQADPKSVLPPGTYDSAKQVFLQWNTPLFPMVELANIKTPKTPDTTANSNGSVGHTDVVDI